MTICLKVTLFLHGHDYSLDVYTSSVPRINTYEITKLLSVHSKEQKASK